MKKVIIILSLSTFSLLAFSNDVKKGARIVNSAMDSNPIESINSVRIIDQDASQVKIEVNATVEGNICGATELVSQLTSVQGLEDDWDAHISNSSYKLSLVAVGPSSQEFAACAMYSKLTSVNIELSFYNQVGPAETNAFQKKDYLIKSSGSQYILLTEEYGKGWSITLKQE